MSDDPIFLDDDPEPPPPGYDSAEAKQRNTRTLILLSVGFFLSQMALSCCGVMGIYGWMAYQFFNETIARPQSGTYWQGEFVMPAKHLLDQQGYPEMVRWPRDPEGKPGTPVPMPFSDGTLLADPDHETLWCISSEGVARLVDGQFEEESPTQLPEKIYAPFLYEGHPAVLVEDADGVHLWSFQDGDWVALRDVALTWPGGVGWAPVRDLRVVLCGDTWHLFVRIGQDFYHGEGLPLVDAATEVDAAMDVEPGAEVEPAANAEAEPTTWTLITSGFGWGVGQAGGEPVLFSVISGPRGQGQTVGWRQKDGAWTKFYTSDSLPIPEMGVYPLEEPGQFMLITAAPVLGAHLREFKDFEVLGEEQLGGMFTPQTFVLFAMSMNLVMVPLSLLYIWLASRSITRHRSAIYRSGHRSARPASLGRRCIAALIDWLPSWLPIMTAMFMFMYRFDFLSSTIKPQDLQQMIPIIIGAVAWSICWTLGISMAEGWVGCGPGKWLLGLRVKTLALQPCGFGRALVRCLLMFADQFYNGIVAVLMIGMTAARQRVGDLVAGTIVIRAGSIETDPEPPVTAGQS